MTLSRLQLRVRNRQTALKRNAFCSAIDSSAYAICTLGWVLTLLVILISSPEPTCPFVLDSNLFRHAVPMPAAIRDDVMRVMLMRDGAIYFRNVRAAGEDLPDLIQQSLQSGAERKVYLIVDPRARYAALSIVLDGVRAAGIQDIVLLAESPYMHM